MPFAREIILFILDYIRFRVPKTSEKDSYYTVLGNTLVRVSNHCTWLHIWDDMLKKNPKWKGMRIVSIVFEDQNDTFNNNCLVLNRERRKPIRVEEYVYPLNGNAHYLSKDEIKAIINSIKMIERNNSFSDPTGKAKYCPRVSVNPSSANTTMDRNGNTTYSTNYGYGADYVSESIENKQHKTRYNMKKTIRLTESDLHRVIKESVQTILKESNITPNLEQEMERYRDNPNRFMHTLNAYGMRYESILKDAEKMGLDDIAEIAKQRLHQISDEMIKAREQWNLHA